MRVALPLLLRPYATVSHPFCYNWLRCIYLGRSHDTAAPPGFRAWIAMLVCRVSWDLSVFCNCLWQSLLSLMQSTSCFMLSWAPFVIPKALDLARSGCKFWTLVGPKLGSWDSFLAQVEVIFRFGEVLIYQDPFQTDFWLIFEPNLSSTWAQVGPIFGHFGHLLT